MIRPLSAAVVLLLAACVQGQDAPLLKPPVYWFHVMANTNNDENMAKVYALMERAAKAGYTGMAYHDGRFIMQRFQTPEYIAKVKKLRQKATELKLSIAVELMPVGYGDEFLMNDVNMAEGMPVRKAAFIVKDGKLVPHDPDVHLVNGGLEEWTNGKPAHWDLDDIGTISSKDEQDKAEGAASVRMTDISKGQFKRTRLIQRFAVQPYHNYRISAMVKTKDFADNQDVRMMALAKVPLNWTTLPIEKTMDWKRVSVTFNSLDATEVGAYLGSWNGRTGTIWWDDVQIEAAGFVNIIRRDALPLTITSEDGKTTYDEGKDFSKVSDPLLTPCVTAWHQPPTVTIPDGSRLKEGQKVLASYHHAMTNLAVNNTPVCMSEPKVYEDCRHQVTFTKATLQPDMYFLGHDEIRQCGYDDQCAKRKLTPGQILADNIAKSVKIVEEIDPGKPIVVWNDMFDPYHNAKKTEDDGSPAQMFLAKGDAPWWESWKGMPKQLGVVNWNNGNVKSVKFFAGENHQQVLSHDSPEGIAKWIAETADCKGIAGVMYTTWEDNWGPLEQYIEAAKRAEAKLGRR